MRLCASNVGHREGELTLQLFCEESFVYAVSFSLSAAAQLREGTHAPGSGLMDTRRRNFRVLLCAIVMTGLGLAARMAKGLDLL